MQAVVTDSTWSLPEALAEQWGITVVPLHVIGPDAQWLDGGEHVDLEAGRLTTSQPSTHELEAALVAAGAAADGLVCVHLSGELSGTAAAMSRAAEQYRARSGLPVTVIDARTVGAALGFSAAVAAATLASGGAATLAVARARETAARSRVVFTVAELRHLQRGGRLSAPRAMIGAALGIRPVLEIREGAIRLREPVRGAARARSALAAAVTEGLPPGPVSLAVHHVGAQDAADELAEQLRQAAKARGASVERVEVTPMSAVLAVHAGPGALAAVSAPTFGLLGA